MQAVHFNFIFEGQATSTRTIEHSLADLFRWNSVAFSLVSSRFRIAHRIRIITRLVLISKLGPWTFAIYTMLMIILLALAGVTDLHMSLVNARKVVDSTFAHPLVALVILPARELVHVHVEALWQMVASLLLNLVTDA